MQAYDRNFYEMIGRDAQCSASVMVPLVLSLVGSCQSVVDVGCGNGTWLRVFSDHGVERILGVDGDFVPRDQLQIDQDAFLPHDLNAPLELNMQFDLAISLEVAEHLSPESAETIVDTLTNLAPAVLFSAAIPHQTGTNHINEQWPEYWASLFARRGYEPIDCIRRRVWTDKRVAWWYAQNTILYVTNEFLKSHPTLEQNHVNLTVDHLAIVHPGTYLAKECVLAERTAVKPLGLLIADIVYSVRRAIRRRVWWFTGRSTGCKEFSFTGK